jgi:hypothetical protein
MTDPFPTLMLMRVLGSDYQIIDSETHIRFLAQARGKATARFVLDEDTLAEIRAATAGGDKYFAKLQVDITNDAGKAVAQVEKQIYLRLRRELRTSVKAGTADGPPV